MKNPKPMRITPRLWNLHVPAGYALLLLLFAGACSDPAPPPEEETLAEYVARCESFRGEDVRKCPDDCSLADTIPVLWDGATCQQKPGPEGMSKLEPICLAADPDSVSVYGHRIAYRRVHVGEGPNDATEPYEPEDVQTLMLHNKEIYGWERCTEATSAYCDCALQYDYREEDE